MNGVFRGNIDYIIVKCASGLGEAKYQEGCSKNFIHLLDYDVT